MKFKKLNSHREADVNISQYKIDWDRKVSGPQFAVKEFLYPYWKRKIILEEFRIPGSLLRLDLVNITDRVIVEVSPNSTHNEYNPFFHGKNPQNFANAIQRDLAKHKWAEQNDFVLVEIFDEDIGDLSSAWFKEKYNIYL